MILAQTDPILPLTDERLTANTRRVSYVTDHVFLRTPDPTSDYIQALDVSIIRKGGSGKIPACGLTCSLLRSLFPERELLGRARPVPVLPFP